ncbi:MAG: glucose-6-phosphate isomerase [Hyphomicrobiaceae bacterium]|nr:glucose-6-phosphate isomerase [Hyphomicrobiaceae bacterium]
MPHTVEPGPVARTADLPFRLDIEGCLEACIGSHGLGPTRLAHYLTRLEAEVEKLKDNARTGRLPLLTIVRETQDIAEARAALDRLADGARLIVFFGTGGSSLGGETLAQLAGWNIPGAGDAGKRHRPRTRFYANLDGATLTGALDSLDLAATRFVVTSKSGGTAETLAQAIAALSAVKSAGLADAIPRMFLGITEEDKPGKPNGLRRLFAAHAIPILAHHEGIGGRFSCLTNVGLIPGMARGLDAAEVRAGAAAVVDCLLAAKRPRDLPAALGAAVAIGLARDKKVGTSVMMPYADRLGRLAHWYVQLWAESLGKSGQGTTPIAAMGPLDQHSQLQLYMDGPRDHMLTVLRVPTAGLGPLIDPALAELSGAGYLAGRHVGDIVDAQSHALPQALARAGRPVRTLDLARLDAYTMGAVMMHFMMETILAGRLIGIDPFDQPAVELAKVLTRERLAGTG